MFYKTHNRFPELAAYKKGTSKTYLVWCVLIMSMMSCGSGGPDCPSQHESQTQKLSEEGSSFVAFAGSDSKNISFKNSAGQSRIFVRSEPRISLEFEEEFIECGNDFVFQPYQFENVFISYEANGFYLELLAKRGLVAFMPSFVFSENTLGCITEIIQVQYFETINSFGTNFIIEPIQNTCFQATGLDNFEFLDSITLNGDTYTDVYSSVDNSFSPVKIYYNKMEGIIGFEDSENIIWSLL